MKRLGSVKQCTKVEGHQDCGVCHPGTKGGRSFEERRWRRLEMSAFGPLPSSREIRATTYVSK